MKFLKQKCDMMHEWEFWRWGEQIYLFFNLKIFIWSQKLEQEYVGYTMKEVLQ